VTLPPEPRTVRPRVRKHKRLPVIAVSRDVTVTEHGKAGTTEELIAALPSMPSTLFAKRAAADWLSELDAHFDSDPRWQWRAATSEREIIRPDGKQVATRITTVIHYFGWKGGNFHKLIDPLSMYGRNLDDIYPGPEPLLERLLKWAVELRDFCDENMLEVRPTIGGISAQFLTDRRFYPEPRRKVPRTINDRGREQLPGNHYALTVAPSPRHEYTALYLDQSRAHHYHARTVPLPSSDSLYAYGRFIDLDEVAFKTIPEGFHGLYCLDLELPARRRSSHWITKSERQFVYSCEIQHLVDMGYRILGVRAAWGSYEQDTGLAKYAEWALTQPTSTWLKPLLLATYGTLALKGNYSETVFRLAKRGEPVTLRTGRHRLSGMMVQRKVRLESGIVNVLHRGMIEAATRSESLGLAQWLTSIGFRVLSIYADAVIVEDNPDTILPALPEPWRIKDKLNHLRFVSQQAFISGEMTKLPGVSQELRRYARNGTGHAPRKRLTEAATGITVTSNRRI
jgi:hypothetical protein